VLRDGISVPFQNNFNFGAGTNRALVWDLNFQPVIPIHLNEDWNLVLRESLVILHLLAELTVQCDFLVPAASKSAVN
jgi:hypothetical protein